jgi:hypothetical protein
VFIFAWLLQAGMASASPSIESCEKEPLEVQYDCSTAVLRNPPPVLDDTTTPKTVIRDCLGDRSKCLGVWRDVDFTLSKGFGTFTSKRIPKRFGTESDWTFRCKQDEITDKKSCVLEPDHAGSGFAVIYDGSSNARRLFIRGQGKAFPGSLVSVRVDSRPAHGTAESTPFSLASSKVILLEMSSGSTIRTRFWDWPYNTPQDNRADLGNFKEIASLADALAADFFGSSKK